MLNANYLRDRMTDAIGDTLVKGVEIMQWFQDCADILAKQERPISWTTPVGLKITQAYRKSPPQRVHTLVGHLDFWPEDPNDAIAKRKQVLSIAPNIIHSFDGAHMMLSVLAMDTLTVHRTHFGVIHDSFGCHASDMTRFATVIREVFANIYETNWFTSLARDFLEGADEGTRLTEVPVRGTLDIRQVRQAEFFFA
jgi:DNA-directed RNA polymerase